MSDGFHTATICSNCDPPVVAISTGYGSRCPRCGQVDVGGDRQRLLDHAARCGARRDCRQIAADRGTP